MRMKKLLTRLSLLILIIFMMGGSFYMGTKYNKEAGNTTVIPEKYSKIYEILSDKWLNYNDLENMDEEMLKGMVKGLNDPYTQYLTKEEAKSLYGALSDESYGIGVAINDSFIIEAVQMNSPAKNAGLQIGDKIVSINNEEIKDIDQLVEMISSNECQDLSIQILRDNQYYTVNCSTVLEDGTVLYDIMENEDHTYGYLAIYSFGTNTPSKMEEAMIAFSENDIKDLVIDLRYNPGGYVESAVECLGYLFGNDELVCVLTQTDGKTTEFKTENEEQYKYVNGYVLVSRYTASAAEIFAGCLQEKLDYKLIGENTYGKGIAQIAYTFSDQSILKYTYASWSLPSGKEIQGVGLEVDEEEDIQLSNFYVG